MPRYYFDVHDRTGVHPDGVGDEFEGLEQAMTHAQGLLVDLVRDDPPDTDQQVVGCELRDEMGRVVYRGEFIFRTMQCSD